MHENRNLYTPKASNFAIESDLRKSTIFYFLIEKKMCNLKTLSLLKLGVMTLFCLVAISCTKDTIVNGYLPPLPIPDGVSVTYGDTLSYQLPEEYSADDISLEITVDHPGQQVDKDHSLLDLVKQSIKFDREHSRMFIFILVNYIQTIRFHPNFRIRSQKITLLSLLLKLKMV